MFYFTDSASLWIRLILLLICETVLVYAFITKKDTFSKSFKTFFLFIMLSVPVVMLGMIVNRFNALGAIRGSAQSVANALPVIIGILILAGLVTVSVMRLKEGNLTVIQRNTIILGLIGVFLGILLFLVARFWL